MSNEYSDDEPRKKKRSGSSDVDELREVAEVLPDLFGALNESIPKLISGLIGSIYSPEAAGNMAKGIGQFYNNLIAEGLPEDVALEMTKKFVSTLDFGKFINMVSNESSTSFSKRKKKHHDRDEFDEEDEEFDEEFD
ncbi:hypothetical protein EU527_06900 [Candidatus Thorarchaeota archaeon]|nr:MAG: hypothetical protein EU527_06900 [Candidatus Thorarchaeota archaeon]